MSHGAIGGVGALHHSADKKHIYTCGRKRWGGDHVESLASRWGVAVRISSGQWASWHWKILVHQKCIPFPMKWIRMKLKSKKWTIGNDSHCSRKLEKSSNERGTLLDLIQNVFLTLNSGTKWSLEAFPRVLQLPTGGRQEEWAGTEHSASPRGSSSGSAEQHKQRSLDDVTSAVFPLTAGTNLPLFWRGHCF